MQLLVNETQCSSAKMHSVLFFAVRGPKVTFNEIHKPFCIVTLVVSFINSCVDYFVFVRTFELHTKNLICIAFVHT